MNNSCEAQQMVQTTKVIYQLKANEQKSVIIFKLQSHYLIKRSQKKIFCDLFFVKFNLLFQML